MHLWKNNVLSSSIGGLCDKDAAAELNTTKNVLQEVQSQQYQDVITVEADSWWF